MKVKHAAPLVLTAAIAALFVSRSETASSFDSFVARDPGVREEPAGAGGPLPGLSSTQAAFFTAGADDFAEAEEVADGLGPRMNANGCGSCHIQPALGGSSPHPQVGTPPFGNVPNPQFGFATENGAADSAPPFIRADGPVREARFVRNPDGSPDGGVHALFTITGRAGADAGCTLRQPDFVSQMRNNNVIFRIPTPVFGGGLMEAIPDSALLANQASNTSQKQALGIRGKANFAVSGRTISGSANNNGNDGTIARFGWKAQNKSLLLFSGEAYNVEMGITNELFQTEREEDPRCQYAAVPNDTTNTESSVPTEVISAIEKFAFFARFLDAPKPSLSSPGGSTSIARGRQRFADVGCALCHTPSFTTGSSPIEALRYKPVNLFSDLLVHDMGDGLADGVSQGEAGPREFRTAPLWGLGQRVFFLHDGRTSDLKQAIRQHASSGSEANSVVSNFNDLREGDKQDLLNFLRSL
jgi:CxxC motif-containing protein (DUF1111 family)